MGDTTLCSVEDAITVLIEGDIAFRGGAKEDALLSTQAFSDLESKLSAAPMALVVLGHLATIAGPDFSLVPADGDKSKFFSLKYPQSYRASLSQVGNETFSALRTAHGNMQYIEISLGRVPKLTEDIVKVLMEDSESDIKEMLPQDLKNMRKIIHENKAKIEEVLEKFKIVIKSVEEMVEVSLLARGRFETDSMETDVALDIAANEQKEYEKQVEVCEKELEEMKEKVKKEEQELKEELEKSTSLESFLNAAVRQTFDTTMNTILPTACMAGALVGLTASAKTLETGFISAAMAAPSVAQSVANAIGQKKSAQPAPEQLNVDLADVDVQNLVGALQKVCEELEGLFGDENGAKAICEEAASAGKKIAKAKQLIEKQKTKAAEVEETYIRTKDLSTARKICSQLEELIANIEKATRNLDGSSSKSAKELYEKLQKLKKRCDELMENTQVRSGNSSPFNMQSPSAVHAAKQTLGTAKDKSNLAKGYVEQMYKRLEFRKEQLKSLEKRADDLREKKLATNQYLLKTIREIKQFEARKETFGKTLQMISKGLRALNKMREQWQKLYFYFQAMDNVIEAALGPTMQSFVELSGIASKRFATEGTASLSAFYKDRLYKQAFMAVRTAHAVHFLAHSYLGLSKKHLMPLLDHFGIILSLNSESDEFTTQRDTLDKLAVDAQNGIAAIVQEGYEKFRDSIAKRQQEMEDVFARHLPAITQEERRAIETQVKQVKERAIEGTSADHSKHNDDASDWS